MFKSLVVFSILTATPVIPPPVAIAQEAKKAEASIPQKPLPEPLVLGQSVHFRTWNEATNECGLTWASAKYVSLSGNGDIGEFELVNTGRTVWIPLRTICDTQKFRAETPVTPKDKK